LQPNPCHRAFVPLPSISFGPELARQWQPNQRPTRVDTGFISANLVHSYDTPTEVRYLDDSLREEDLVFLVNIDENFLIDVEWNPALFERVKKGLCPQAATDTAEDEVVEDRTAEDKLLDETIEDALLNRVHFAREQLLRTSLCHDYLSSDDEKESVVREVYEQLDESLLLLKQWGSEITLDAYANDLEYHDMAVRLGRLVGIDLPRLVGSETETQNGNLKSPSTPEQKSRDSYEPLLSADSSQSVVPITQCMTVETGSRPTTSYGRSGLYGVNGKARDERR
jgi:hypothetical protein